MWERNILTGQWLFVACCMAYLVWWCVAFRPGYSAPALLKTVPFALTALFGIAGLSFVIMGCQGAKDAAGDGVAGAISNIHIIGACAAAYVILLIVTNVVMHRQVTSAGSAPRFPS